jgi:hypothetical protein
VSLRLSRGLALAALASFSAGCAVPLGPGFFPERQSYEVRLITAPAPRFHVRAVYRLKNTGDRPLEFLEAALPDVASTGRSGLRVLADDVELVPQAPEDAQSRSIQIPFTPPWPQKKRLELVIEYDLAPPSPGHAGVSVEESSAHLRHSDWFPRLSPPEHVFARHAAPGRLRLSVFVPPGFVALAGGNPKGTRRSDSGTEYRFEIEDDKDLGPFVVAGRYSEARINAAGSDVVFWTFQPLEPEGARQAAMRIAEDYKTYETVFGRLRRRHQTLWIAETHARLTPHPGRAESSPAGIGFPDGALLNSRAFGLGVTSGTFLDLVSHELAHSWFGLLVKARPEADAVLSEALAEYATIVAAEAREGDPARRHQAALLLRWFDEHRANYADQPLVNLRPGDPWEQRVFGYSKGALFFLALEDEIGKDEVRRGLARFVHALQLDEAGFHELRSAMEGEAGRDLADFFRTWLNHAGIPDAFRSRYEVKVAAAKPRFDLLQLGVVAPCVAKGRLQEMHFATTDEIVAAGKEAVPVLIELIADERKLSEPVICFWHDMTVGDLAFAILTDLFQDSTWTKSTVAGASQEEMLGPKAEDTPFVNHYLDYVEQQGRKSLQDKWWRIWDRVKDSLYWDEKELCFKVR